MDYPSFNGCNINNNYPVTDINLYNGLSYSNCPQYINNINDVQNGYIDNYVPIKALGYYEQPIKQLENHVSDNFSQPRTNTINNCNNIAISENVLSPVEFNKFDLRQYNNNNENNDKVLSLYDLIKLTDVIRELSSKLPPPPSKEILKSVHPTLAANLQLAYLKAYINNQQLLLDFKSNIQSVLPNIDKVMYSFQNVPQDLIRSYNTTPSIDDVTINTYNHHTNTINNNLNMIGDCVMSSINPSNDKIIDISDDMARTLSDKIPKNFRSSVKYSSQKNCYVSVYMGSAGVRVRKAFSIKKYGCSEALALAMQYASSGLESGVSVARKERFLLEDIITMVFTFNSDSWVDIESYNKAISMDVKRGIVYSSGSKFWLSIHYDANSKRIINGFDTKKFGFEGAYKKSEEYLNKMINSGFSVSKLCGPVGFWLEEVSNIKVLCIILKFKDLTSKDCSETIYIGRFDIFLYGGLVKARKTAQEWRRSLKKEILLKDSKKIPGIYYNSKDNKWIVNKNVDGIVDEVAFSASNLGFDNAAKQAIEFRVNILSSCDKKIIDKVKNHMGYWM